MAKDTYYFPHDYNPTEDEKIMGLLAEYGATGYGLYWRFVELLHSTPEHRLQKKAYFIVAIAKQMNSTSDFLLQFLDDCVNKFELFEQDHDFIFSGRVFRNIAHKAAKTEIAKANGSKGGVAKAKQTLATAKQNVAIKGNESKGNKRIFIAPSATDVQDYFKECGYSMESAIKAFNYYSSAEWKDSQGKQVKNWKQKMQGVWFTDENKIKSSQSRFVM